MRATALATLALLAGCHFSGEHDWGWDLGDCVPLDGSQLGWDYANDDNDDRLEVDKIGSEVVDGREIVTLAHSLTNAEGETTWVADVRWETDHTQGVFLHGYRDADGDRSFDPPVRVAEASNRPGDVLVTQSAGQTWTVTFEGFDGCATYWVPEWGDDDCAVISIDDGDGDASTNGVVTGEYRLVRTWGFAWLDLDAYDALWRLTDHRWEE
jgi:hypothetical protein